MKNLTQNEINYIAQQAKNQLARNYYKDYITQVHHGSYEHFRHTLLICDYLQRIAEGEQLHLMIEVPPRHGKLCADSTPVYTPNGWKTHGQLKVGDYVYHPSGKPIKVTHVKPKYNADWIVEFSNGEQIRTHECHEWTVYNRNKKKYETLETQDMKDDCNNDIKNKYILPEVALFKSERRISVVSVECRPNGEIGNCITVDSPDGLYLVGNTLLPTHNSMTVTETFPSYYLGRNPEKRVITSAYSEGLARKFGRLNRNKFAEMSDNIFGVSLATDNTSNTDWGIKGHRGGMISTGIGGSITGQGADCVLGSTLIDTEIGKIRIDELHKMVHKPKVLSYNHDKEITEYKTIEASRESISNRLITINTMRGNTLTTTSDHRYFTIDKGYTESSNLWFDSLLMDSHNNIDMVDEIIPEKNTVNVYDIQVADNHNFFANNVLVHNCMIIDDPIKNAKEALSKTIRDNIWNEWESTLSTRLHDGASVIVIMTRWHEDDLIGRLLEKSPYNWIRLRLPAIAEDDDDLLNREIGEALCPELGYDEEWAALKKVEVGSRTWASLYQQRPAPEQGSIIKREWLKYIGAVPARADNLVMSWDFTFKDSQASDYVVGQVWQKTGANYYMIDQVRGQMDFTSSKRALINLKKKYPRCRTILVEDKANGTAIINALQKDISGIIPITPRESKEARAYAVTPYFEAGNVYILENIQDLNDTVEEFVAFPNGKNDDRVDCATQALNYFASKPQASVITTNAW
ncbi:Transposase and inactivated derivatives [Staphylococcus simulans]|nr:Transposase and inactivated derivatives [Staphylococcus simulans]